MHFPNKRNLFKECFYCIFHPTYWLWRYGNGVMPAIKYKAFGVGDERFWVKIKRRIFGCGSIHVFESRSFTKPYENVEYSGMKCKFCGYSDFYTPAIFTQLFRFSEWYYK